MCRPWPVFARRDSDGGTTLFNAVPAFPHRVLRSIASGTGVHIYADSGVQVFAAGDCIALHASFEGTRRIRLRGASRVVDALTGEVLCENGDSFEVSLSRGQTGIWQTRS